MSFDFEKRRESIPNILYTDGIPVGNKPYINKFGLELPDVKSSVYELWDLYSLIISEDISSDKTKMTLPTVEQLEKITINASTGCWELPIYRNGKDVYPEGSPNAGQPRARYGRLKIAGVNSKSALAHIDMYIALMGEIPKGYALDHLCENPRCCWPRHLEPVTPGDNTRRAHHARRLQAGQGILF